MEDTRLEEEEEGVEASEVAGRKEEEVIASLEEGKNEMIP